MNTLFISLGSARGDISCWQYPCVNAEPDPSVKVHSELPSGRLMDKIAVEAKWWVWRLH